jgi:hypothetical protein
MKTAARFSLSCFFLLSAFIINAQTFNSHPWMSKDVQKIANSKMLKDEKLNALHIEAVSVGYPAIAMSKGVHRIGAKSTTNEKGNIVAKGYPYWTVSKGVQRIGRK